MRALLDNRKKIPASDYNWWVGLKLIRETRQLIQLGLHVSGVLLKTSALVKKKLFACFASWQKEKSRRFARLGKFNEDICQIIYIRRWSSRPLKKTNENKEKFIDFSKNANKYNLSHVKWFFYLKVWMI